MAEEIASVGNGRQIKSGRSRLWSYVRFVNRTSRKLDIIWLNYEGIGVKYRTLLPRHYVDVNTFVGHPWMFMDNESGERMVVELREVFEPVAWRAEEGPPRRRIVNITIPVYTLKKRCLLVLKKLIPFSAVPDLEIPETLKSELLSLCSVMDRGKQKSQTQSSSRVSPTAPEQDSGEGTTSQGQNSIHGDGQGHTSDPVCAEPAAGSSGENSLKHSQAAAFGTGEKDSLQESGCGTDQRHSLSERHDMSGDSSPANSSVNGHESTDVGIRRKIQNTHGMHVGSDSAAASQSRQNQAAVDDGAGVWRRHWENRICETGATSTLPATAPIGNDGVLRDLLLRGHVGSNQPCRIPVPQSARDYSDQAQYAGHAATASCAGALSNKLHTAHRPKETITDDSAGNNSAGHSETELMPDSPASKSNSAGHSKGAATADPSSEECQHNPSHCSKQE